MRDRLIIKLKILFHFIIQSDVVCISADVEGQKCHPEAIEERLTYCSIDTTHAGVECILALAQEDNFLIHSTTKLWFTQLNYLVVLCLPQENLLLLLLLFRESCHFEDGNERKKRSSIQRLTRSHSSLYQSPASSVLVFVFQRGRELKGCRKCNKTTSACDGHRYTAPTTHYCLQHPPTIVVTRNISHSFNTEQSTNHLRARVPCLQQRRVRQSKTPCEKKKENGLWTGHSLTFKIIGLYDERAALLSFFLLHKQGTVWWNTKADTVSVVPGSQRELDL